jgi:hypothetical protein
MRSNAENKASSQDKVALREKVQGAKLGAAGPTRNSSMIPSARASIGVPPTGKLEK